MKIANKSNGVVANRSELQEINIKGPLRGKGESVNKNNKDIETFKPISFIGNESPGNSNHQITATSICTPATVAPPANKNDHVSREQFNHIVRSITCSNLHQYNSEKPTKRPFPAERNGISDDGTKVYNGPPTPPPMPKHLLVQPPPRRKSSLSMSPPVSLRTSATNTKNLTASSDQDYTAFPRGSQSSNCRTPSSHVSNFISTGISNHPHFLTLLSLNIG